MNKMNILAIAMLLGVCLSISSCSNDEEVLTPSGINSGYKVPQGNHDYDTTIVNIFNRYGTNLLYKFTDKDTYWTPSGWKNGVVGLAANGALTGYLVTPADEQYVKQQLIVLNRLWFSFYSDAFMKKFLPVKVMLCSKVQNCTWGNTPAGYGIVTIDKPSYYNYDNICVGYGSSAVNNIKSTDSVSIAQDINRCFIESMIGRGLTAPTSGFTSAVSYASLTSLTTNTAFWARGIFPPSYSASSAADWKKFLYMLVTYPESYLTRKPTKATSTTDNSEAAWEGILNPVKDTNGLLKKRYDMVRNYFINNYGMDLQIVGNYNTIY